MKEFHQRIDDAELLAFSYEKNAELIGHGEIALRESNEGRICRVIIKESKRGLGLGKRFSEALIAHAFNDLALSKLTLNVFDFNTPALKCYQSIGFKEYRRAAAARAFKAEKWGMIYLELDR